MAKFITSISTGRMKEVRPTKVLHLYDFTPALESSYSSREWSGLHNQQNFYFRKNKCTASINHLNFINNERLLRTYRPSVKCIGNISLNNKHNFHNVKWLAMHPNVKYVGAVSEILIHLHVVAGPLSNK